MPANALTVLLLILLNAANVVGRLWPYVVGGIASAGLLSYLARAFQWQVPRRLPDSLALPAAALLGASSPLSTIGMVPVMLELQIKGLSSRVALTFILASSLLNPQLFALTLGGMGVEFALAQLLSVLVLSAVLGLAFGNQLQTDWNLDLTESGQRRGLAAQLIGLTEHIGLYFLVGVTIASTLEVLLPLLGVIGWLGDRGFLSTPLVGWIGAPFYTCGGSAVPLASSLMRTGLAPDVLFVFLLVGPALRGTTLGALGCLMPKRAQLLCLAALVSAGGLMGYVFRWWMGVL
ncbi:MAG: permease [Anaerolineae bacterium]